MSRVHELYRELQEARIQLQAMRVDNFKLRNENKALKQREESLIKRWNSSQIKQNQREHALAVLTMSAEERQQYLKGSTEPEVIDARQYESLSVERAGVEV